MPKICTICLLAGVLAIQIARAQPATPFSASWSFEGDLNGFSSTPQVVATTASLAGIRVTSVGGTPPGYPSGQVGKAVSLQNWTDPACPGDEYIEIMVSPVSSATMTLSTLSFYYSRSNTGPVAIKVKHSLDGYAAAIYDSPITVMDVPYQYASINLTGISSGFTNQTAPVSFRIYGCDRMATNGTIRLDEITLNATALPVTLLSFTAKPEGDRVQVAWSTTSERDADRFMVERSPDLREFAMVGEVTAKGTTDARQYYGLTDQQPRPGINYYRLKQLDFDGTIHFFKPVSAIIRTDEPSVAVFPNPANADRIHLRLWNAGDAIIRLFSLTGQVIGGRLEHQSGEADFIPEHTLPAGLYWLDMQTNGQRRISRILVR